MKFGIALFFAAALLAGCQSQKKIKTYLEETRFMGEKIIKSDAQWKKELSPEQYYVTRQAGTERAFSGELLNEKGEGVYACVGCGLSLFDSSAKFDSGTGWPSYFEPVEKTHITDVIDSRLGVRRIEVRCTRCGAHLGHVFEDGPAPTGLRYCINSAALSFEPQSSLK